MMRVTATRLVLSPNYLQRVVVTVRVFGPNGVEASSMPRKTSLGPCSQSDPESRGASPSGTLVTGLTHCC